MGQLGGWQLAGMAAMAAVLFAVGGLSSALIIGFVQRSTTASVGSTASQAPGARSATLPLTGGSAAPEPAPVPLVADSPDPSPVPSPSPTSGQAPRSPSNSPAAPTVSPAAAPIPTPLLFVRITTASYGNLAVSTLPGANCTAKAKWPSGNNRQVQGLQGARVADASGSVTWSYKTDPQASSGEGSYSVTCNFDGQTQTATAEFTIP
jgi:hypothetical protein